MKYEFHRRQILRGLLAGGVVSVGLPILDAALNENGDAFAATGKPLPIRFATWFWPLGFGEGDWTPKKTGTGYDLPDPMQALKPFQERMNLFTGSQVTLDGQGTAAHFATVASMMTGDMAGVSNYGGSVDYYVAQTIGASTRFRSLLACCSGDKNASWSGHPQSGAQPAEVSPARLYTRIFGPEFHDPNSATFTPDRNIMLRKSVLSVITDDRQAIMRQVGAADKAKLDSYFTSLRALEQKLDTQLQKPEPMPACAKPTEVAQDDGGTAMLTEVAMQRQEVFTQLFIHALACDQTRVVNLALSAGLSGLRREGSPTSHHTYSHEEAVDPATGYQPSVLWFAKRNMKGLHDFVSAFDAFREGDRSLLDRMLIFAYTDHGAPRYHSPKNIPYFTFGNAGGRVNTGMHIARAGEPATRVSLTVQQAMGVPVSDWGTKANRVTSPVPGVLV